MTIIRSSILSVFRRLAYSLNLDPIALMKSSGIDLKYLDDPDLSLPMSALANLLENAARTSGIPDFGLRLAEARGLPELGPVTLMIREEETLRAALRTLVSFIHLHSTAAFLHMDDCVDPILSIEIMMDTTSSCRQAMDASVASIMSILRWLLGESWSPLSIHFTHSRPASTARFERFFRCPIDFLQEFNGIVLRGTDLDKSLKTSYPGLRRQVERYIRTINVAPSDTYVHQVTQIIAILLPKGEVRADVVAQHLGIDSRTLNRRLARAELNYSAVLDNTRKNLTAQHLLGGDRPVSDIAGLVGFGSLSAFSTWFRHAFGCTPSSWRKRETEAAYHSGHF